MIDKTTGTALATATTVSAVGSLFGELSIIIVASVFGAAVAASRLNGLSKAATVRFMFRSVSITTFSAGMLAQFLQSDWFSAKTGVKLVDSYYFLAFLSFWVAVVGDGWFKVKDSALTWLAGRFNGVR